MHLRPLLGLTKSDLTAYAERHQLNWHEDPTNQDDAYLRNYVRHKILPKLSPTDRQQLLANLNRLARSNQEIDHLLGLQLASHSRPTSWTGPGLLTCHTASPRSTASLVETIKRAKYQPAPN